MARNEKTKTRAFKLLKEDVGHREIAEKLNVSLRTIQRWAKEIEPVPIKVLVEEFNDKTNEKIPPQNPLSNHQFDVTLSRRVAIRLLHLSETAIAAVEDTLSNPDTSTANKLKAAKIAGDWLGLGENATMYAETSLIRRAEQAFDTEFLPPRSSELPPFEPFSGEKVTKKEILNPLTGKWEVVS